MPPIQNWDKTKDTKDTERWENRMTSAVVRLFDDKNAPAVRRGDAKRYRVSVVLQGEDRFTGPEKKFDNRREAKSWAVNYMRTHPAPGSPPRMTP